MIQDNSYLKTHLQICKMEDIDIVETRSTLSEDTTISNAYLSGQNADWEWLMSYNHHREAIW